MNESAVTRIVEARLYAWGKFRQLPRRPTTTISSWYSRRVQISRDPDIRVLSLPGRGQMSSSVEQWVTRRDKQVRDAAIIEHTLLRMTAADRRLVWLRYVECNRWGYIAAVLGRDRRTMHRARLRVIELFAAAFGLRG